MKTIISLTAMLLLSFSSMAQDRNQHETQLTMNDRFSLSDASGSGNGGNGVKYRVMLAMPIVKQAIELFKEVDLERYEKFKKELENKDLVQVRPASEVTARINGKVEQVHASTKSYPGAMIKISRELNRDIVDVGEYVFYVLHELHHHLGHDGSDQGEAECDRGASEVLQNAMANETFRRNLADARSRLYDDEKLDRNIVAHRRVYGSFIGRFFDEKYSFEDTIRMSSDAEFPVGDGRMNLQSLALWMINYFSNMRLATLNFEGNYTLSKLMETIRIGVAQDKPLRFLADVIDELFTFKGETGYVRKENTWYRGNDYATSLYVSLAVVELLTVYDEFNDVKKRTFSSLVSLHHSGSERVQLDI